ncbi:histone H1-II-like [Camellia sinensis]|uniref:histone H1-II-like n=1 Tax=Camellia sinensis TaxID=4442 RepID=UPI001036A067|nr:histone H1-II-like [Camellia sinensis]
MESSDSDPFNSFKSKKMVSSSSSKPLSSDQMTKAHSDLIPWSSKTPEKPANPLGRVRNRQTSDRDSLMESRSGRSPGEKKPAEKKPAEEKKSTVAEKASAEKKLKAGKKLPKEDETATGDKKKKKKKKKKRTKKER